MHVTYSVTYVFLSLFQPVIYDRPYFKILKRKKPYLFLTLQYSLPSDDLPYPITSMA